MNNKNGNQEFLEIYMKIIEDLRENGRVFAEQNPDLAPYLDLSYRKSHDPETERLIESFAYMFAQIEHNSILAKNEYALNFVNQLFPELIMPIPALTVLKIISEKSSFSTENPRYMIPKGTLFSTKNQNGHECIFSSVQESSISCFNIISSSFIDSSIAKEEISYHKKAFVLNFESDISLNINRKNIVNLPIYIDSDFYSSISIYDAIFSSKKPMLLYIDENVDPILLSKENLTPIYSFESQDKSNNILYPFFDYLNYFQKYFFIELKLNIEININKKFKLVIPTSDEVDNLSRVGSNFLHLNCIPIVNSFERKMEPIKYHPDKDEYFMRVDGYAEKDVEILNIKHLETYNSKSGEAYNIPYFHENKPQEKKKIHNLYENLYWSTKRSFYDTTKENGSFYLKLLYTGKKSKEETLLWPDYLFPSGNCTNGKMADYIKPYSEFYCHSSILPIKKSYSLFWPSSSKRPLKNFENEEILKLIYKVNQEMISKKILNEPEFDKIIDYLTLEMNSVKLLINNILFQSVGFISEETVKIQVWNKQTYHVPGIIYKFQFLKKDGFPRGNRFLLNFLNEYFSYIKDFNFFMQFDSELV